MKKLVGVLAVVALAVVAAGCGDRGSDTSGSSSGSTTTAAATAGAGDWGTLKDVCGPNEGGGKVPTGTDSQGVSADGITLGTVADPGFSGRPGLNQEIFDAGDAFVKWCNAAGGINGKTLKLNKHDAALTNYQPVIEQACKTDFSMVGGGAVQDNLWADTGLKCNLIDIAGFAVTPQKAGLAGTSPTASRTVQPVPNPGDRYPIGGVKMVDAKYPGAFDKTGFLYADFQTLQAQYSKESQGFEKAGATIVDTQTYGVNGEANWKPFATTLQNKGVKWVKFIGEGANAAGLELAMQQIGYKPEVRYYETNFYDQAFLDAAGPAANGAFVSTSFIPLEEASTHPATQRYVDNIKKYGGKQALLGLQSTSAWLLFATLAKQCDQDNDLTRDCILKGASAVTEWTGGGLHAASNPSKNEPSDCQMVMQVKDLKFVRWAPTDQDFSCDPGNVAKVKAAK
ncbi:ABC transporter substrate-binding protein [Aquihabitans sp. McL0605]|uniref:ABC transporter substrate-binding protein n=1 Tax=Aquihabitans sp. McL0605 TaxID=3415671 RepID=UPI003CF156E8